MEKLFHARWWDYSSKSFNLNGRICANTLIPFGLLGLALVYVVKPFFFGLYAQMSVQLLTAVDAVLCTGFTADTAISATILVHIRGKAGQAEGDSTEAITAAVRAELSREGILMRRAINAFPHLRLSNKRLHDKLKQERARLKAEVHAREEKLRTEFNERDARLREELRRRKDELKQHRKS